MNAGAAQIGQQIQSLTAILALLNILQIAGCIITIDAISCQQQIARQIIEQQGNSVLAVKENQPNLYEDLVSQYRILLATGSLPFSS
jgi:predicted transposase YbfD/YdcC